MKCAFCQNPMYRRVYLITLVATNGVSNTANFCAGCMEDLVGARALNKLNVALADTSYFGDLQQVNRDDGPVRGPWFYR